MSMTTNASILVILSVSEESLPSETSVVVLRSSAETVGRTVLSATGQARMPAPPTIGMVCWLPSRRAARRAGSRPGVCHVRRGSGAHGDRAELAPCKIFRKIGEKKKDSTSCFLRCVSATRLNRRPRKACGGETVKHFAPFSILVQNRAYIWGPFVSAASSRRIPSIRSDRTAEICAGCRQAVSWCVARAESMSRVGHLFRAAVGSPIQEREVTHGSQETNSTGV